MKLLFLSALLAVSSGVEFQIVNRDGGDVWVGILGNNGKPALNNGGFVLKSGQRVSVQAPEDWAGRFWGRTYCNPSNNHCDTGDCGNKLQCNGAGGAPPASLAEITLKGDQGLDFYDISLVDGFNMQIAIEPQNGKGDNGQYSCKKAACQQHLNDNCPENLKLKTNNGVVGCKSACLAFNNDESCCRGAYGTPDKCKPTASAQYFKSRCPDAYSYAFDDHKSTFTCKAETYVITLGG